MSGPTRDAGNAIGGAVLALMLPLCGTSNAGQEAAPASVRSRARAYEWSANDRSALTNLFSSVSVVEQFLNEPGDHGNADDRGDAKVKEFRFVDMYGDGRIELVALVDESGRDFFFHVFVVGRKLESDRRKNPSMAVFDGFEAQQVSAWEIDSLDSALQDLDDDGLPEIVIPVELEPYRGADPHATIDEVFQWNGRQYVKAGSKFPWFYQQLIPHLEEIARDLEATSESALSADELRSLRFGKASIAKELAEARRRASGKKP